MRLAGDNSSSAPHHIQAFNWPLHMAELQKMPLAVRAAARRCHILVAGSCSGQQLSWLHRSHSSRQGSLFHYDGRRPSTGLGSRAITVQEAF